MALRGGEGVIPIHSPKGSLRRGEHCGAEYIVVDSYQPATGDPVRNLPLYRELHGAMRTSRASPWRKPILARTRLILGLCAEPLPFADRLYRSAWEILRLLKAYKYPHLIRTRSDLILSPEYMELLAPSLTLVCVPIPTSSDRDCRLREPAHPSILRRRIVISQLTSLGYTAVEEPYRLDA